MDKAVDVRNRGSNRARFGLVWFGFMAYQPL